MSENHLMTDKQREIMKLIFEAADRGENITLTDLWLKLSYGHSCSIQAVHCSLKFLEKKWGLISKTRAKGRVSWYYLTPTQRAYAIYRTPIPLNFKEIS